MHIAFDATALPARPGGAGYYIINLVNSLLLNSTPHRISILLHRADINFFHLPPGKQENLIFVSDFPPLLRLAWEQTALPGLLDQMRVDLLHSPHYTMPFRSHHKKVVTFHDMTFFLHPKYHTFTKRLFFPWMIRQSARHADALLAVSESTRRDAIRILNISPERITTTYLGFDPIFRPITDQAQLARIRAKYNLPCEFILHVGTIEPRKNQSILLNAFSNVFQLNPSLKLVLVGSRGWNFGYFSNRLKGLPERDSIQVTGYIEREDMPAIYNLARVFIYPSIYEGFGLPVLEAMACGTPVITSNVSSMPEIAGEGGILVTPNSASELSQAILRILNDSSLAQNLTQKAFARAADFSWEKTADQTMSVYEQFA